MDYIKKHLGWIIPASFILLTIIISTTYLLNAKVDILEDKTYIYIYPNTEKSQVAKVIESQNVVLNSFVFKTFSMIFGYDKVYQGRYEVKKGMTIGKLVFMLSKGRQTPVKLVLGKSRTKEEFAENISEVLAIKKEDLISVMSNANFLRSYGVDTTTVISLFIPNTYEVYWDITINDFFKRMNKEQEKFWKKREGKLKAIGYNKLQVLTIASIIEEETTKDSEKPRMAGVYINRLQKGMPLQADPTIKFAIGDFTIKRITGDMLGVDSPYNTYRNIGLPPSPICIPSIASIDAVLNYERHNFIFFCAKEDFSGFHNFTSDIKEHYANARRYQAALDSMDISE